MLLAQGPASKIRDSYLWQKRKVSSPPPRWRTEARNAFRTKAANIAKPARPFWSKKSGCDAIFGRSARCDALCHPEAKVRKDYRFVGKNGEASFEDLFDGKDTLVIYSMMYGPQRKEGCPMCTATLSSWDPEIPHLQQRLSLVVVARSPYKRIAKYAASRGWKHLPVYSDPSGDYTKDYVGKRDADYPAYHVFMRKDGVVRHFWGAEGGKEIADPGQDPHPAPEYRSALDHSGHNAAGSRQRLVSKIGLPQTGGATLNNLRGSE